ncbi:MAG: DUF6370 family protein [Planctomycetota bacterium]
MIRFAALMLCLVAASCSSEDEAASTTQSEMFVEVDGLKVDAGCGRCQFGLDDDGCELAVRMLETTYLVDGSSIDDHGDAHADDGLCNAVRQAEVAGRVEDGRFIATSFQVLPLEK